MLLKKIKRHHLFYLWNWSWFLLIILLFYPIGYGITRLAIVTLFLSLLLGALLLFWNHKIIRFAGILIVISISLIAVLPGHQVDNSTLRENYVQEMNSFVGTKYAWGGENKIGIDCSGLIRQGLVIANFKSGALSLNPKLIREGFSLWWYDTSAQALGEGYRHKTKVIIPLLSLSENICHF